ncbi:hypothetical protein, partial [Salmonella sp. SAL4445]|uniref:hypothetical protein n=1 Tax=Salmonella sp. SAL4445 TaxID=3159900 RepID=UPI00397E72D2
VHVFGVQPGFTYTSGFDGAGNFNLQAISTASSAVPSLATTLSGGGPAFGVVRIGDSRTANLAVANSGQPGSLLRATFT